MFQHALASYLQNVDCLKQMKRYMLHIEKVISQVLYFDTTCSFKW